MGIFHKSAQTQDGRVLRSTSSGVRTASGLNVPYRAALRPHIGTHMQPLLVKKQIDDSADKATLLLKLTSVKAWCCRQTQR